MDESIAAGNDSTERNEGAPAGARSLTTRAKQFVSDGRRDRRWFVMNLFGRFHVVRRLVRLLRPNPGPPTPGTTMFPEVDVAATVSTLESDGYVTGLRLPKPAVDELVDFASTSVMCGDGEYHWGFTLNDRRAAEAELGRSFGFGNFLHLDEDLPLIAEIGNDPILRRIAAEYFGAEPLHVISRLWWNFAVPERVGAPDEVRRIAAFYHHDKDDFCGVRLFFYLTDVDTTAGPHVVVAGSHRKKSVRQILSIAKRTDEAITGHYGAEKIHTITGSAGSGFLEDPFCFHKSTAPTTTDRLIVELQFTAARYSVFDKDPDRSELSTILAPVYELPSAA